MLLATIGSMLAFWSTALVILYQIRHMQADRNVEVTMRMFEWAESNRMREAIRWVVTEFDLRTWLEQPESERSDFPGLVIAFFEQAGVMIQKRLINEDVVIDNLAASAIRTWERLKPWVELERRQHQDERFGEHFEFLYNRAQAYEARYHRQRNAPV
jgi:hypothetical protein